MPFTFSVPSLNGQTEISIEPGSSVVFVGANGGGKTRLAVYIESVLALNAHRISAHRALTLNPRIAKINEQDALSGLRTGYPNEKATVEARVGRRWDNEEATFLLNDFDFLVQALFADQANLTLENHQKIEALFADPANITQETHQKVQALYVDQANGGDHSVATLTKFRRLVTIWERLLPDRQLHISGDNIQTSVCGSKERYQASEMSDGERAIFYMIGQTLTAASNSILIFDEPELHVHNSIMAKVWDELEAARSDCAFVFITHDLEFAASRVAQKFIIRDFDPSPSPHWTIDKVPENTGFDDAITTLILGSRRPILFVEGHENSLDQAIYRCCFPGWTVIPRRSCQEVIHSVVTMRNNEELTRVICSGIVDADDRQADDITCLDDLGIAVLPVSEIENIILLPPVSRAIAKREGHKGDELEDKLNALKTAVFETLTAKKIDAVVMRYCRRRIDRFLKHIDLSEASTVPDIKKQCDRQIAKLDIEAIAKQAKTRIEDAVRDKDLPKLLANYDNKGLMALAAKHLRNSKLKDFESWFTRILRNNIEPALVTAIDNFLPKIEPQ